MIQSSPRRETAWHRFRQPLHHFACPHLQEELIRDGLRLMAVRDVPRPEAHEVVVAEAQQGGQQLGLRQLQARGRHVRQEPRGLEATGAQEGLGGLQLRQADLAKKHASSLRLYMS